MQVTLAGKSFPLQPPVGLAALDVRLAFPGVEREMWSRRLRWAFGTVGLCWAGSKLGWPDLASCKHDLVAFGEQVHAGLLAEGLLRSDDDVSAVINAADAILGACLPSQKQLDEARDFSRPPSGQT